MVSKINGKAFHHSSINKTLQLNNLKTRTAMNAKISLFVISVKAIIMPLLLK